jgi:hypothetical protein
MYIGTGGYVGNHEGPITKAFMKSRIQMSTAWAKLRRFFVVHLYDENTWNEF